VNGRNAPNYTLAKFLVYIPKSYAPHSYAFNVKNTKQQLLEIQQIPLDGELKFASFGVINMYTNVPRKKMREIILGVLTKNDVD
jgi:hypothetical protein